MPFTNEVPKWDAFLGEFEARQSPDDLKTDLELTHEPCGEVLTDVQHGDSLSSLVSMARTHVCEPAEGEQS